MPRGQRDRHFRPGEASASWNSYREVLAAHGAETINTHKTPRKLGKQVKRVHYDRYVTSLDGLPSHARRPDEIGPSGGRKARVCKGRGAEIVRTMGCMVKSEAGRLSTRHAIPGVRAHKAATRWGSRHA